MAALPKQCHPLHKQTHGCRDRSALLKSPDTGVAPAEETWILFEMFTVNHQQSLSRQRPTVHTVRCTISPISTTYNNCDPTNRTQIKPNNSIIASQKSTIIFSSFPKVNFHKAIENKINTKAKNRIKYKNLFLTISLNVLMAMLNMIHF